MLGHEVSSPLSALNENGAFETLGLLRIPFSHVVQMLYSQHLPQSLPPSFLLSSLPICLFPHFKTKHISSLNSRLLCFPLSPAQQWVTIAAVTLQICAYQRICLRRRDDMKLCAGYQTFPQGATIWGPIRQIWKISHGFPPPFSHQDALPYVCSGLADGDAIIWSVFWGRDVTWSSNSRWVTRNHVMQWEESGPKISETWGLQIPIALFSVFIIMLWCWFCFILCPLVFFYCNSLTQFSCTTLISKSCFVALLTVLYRFECLFVLCKLPWVSARKADYKWNINLIGYPWFILS